uniref:Glycolipid transfer protein b n=1 Tax=Cyprinus carpio carpio TaxID=630221 RepID=A0A9J8AXA5_CYPCA
ADKIGNITVSLRAKSYSSQILLIEKTMYGSEWPKAGATLALMWLKRCLRFIQILMQSLADGEKDEQNPNLVYINITKAYDQGFQVYLYTAFYHTNHILKALSKDREVAEEDFLAKIHQFLINFTATVDAIYEMYSIMNA